MALTYTFLQLKQAVAHALGGDPDARISKGLIVNRAINHLTNAHPWRWRLTTANLSYVASTGDIPLPADFGELVEVRGNAAKYTLVRPITAQQLLDIRTFGVIDSLFLGYMVSGGTQAAGATSAPTYVLRVAPIPSAALTDALSIVYRRDPATFITDDSLTTDDAKYPDIPPGQHDTLYTLCRAFGRRMEEGEQGGGTTDWQMAQVMLKRDMDADARAAPPDHGFMRGGGVDAYMTGGGGIIFRPHSEIRMVGDT